MKKGIALFFAVLLLSSCTAGRPTETTADQTSAAGPSDSTEITGMPPSTDTTAEEQNPMKRTYIHSISELNTSGTVDDHAEEYASSRLESNFREYFSLKPSFLRSTLNY